MHSALATNLELRDIVLLRRYTDRLTPMMILVATIAVLGTESRSLIGGTPPLRFCESQTASHCIVQNSLELGTARGMVDAATNQTIASRTRHSLQTLAKRLRN